MSDTLTIVPLVSFAGDNRVPQIGKPTDYPRAEALSLISVGYARPADIDPDARTVEVPDDVVPGETPGWPINALTGEPLDLTDEQREAIAQITLDRAASAAEPELTRAQLLELNTVLELGLKKNASKAALAAALDDARAADPDAVAAAIADVQA